jgi:hypothetical protein
LEIGYYIALSLPPADCPQATALQRQTDAQAKLTQQFNSKGGEASLCRPRHLLERSHWWHKGKIGQERNVNGHSLWVS